MKKEIRKISKLELNNFISPTSLKDSADNVIYNTEYKFTKNLMYEDGGKSLAGEEFDYDKFLDHIIFNYLPKNKKINVTQDNQKFVSVTFESLLELNLSKIEYLLALNILEKLGIKIEYAAKDITEEIIKESSKETKPKNGFLGTISDYEPWDINSKITKYRRENDFDKKEELLNEIIYKTSGLVVYFMLKSIKLPSYCSKEDAFQEGLIGLLKSIDTFDQTRGVTFATYSYYRIISAINNYKDKSFSNISTYQGHINRTVYRYILKACETNEYDYTNYLTNGLFDKVYELMINDNKKISKTRLKETFDDIASIINSLGSIEFKKLEDNEQSTVELLYPSSFEEEYEEEELEFEFIRKIHEVLNSDYLTDLEKNMVKERFFYKGKQKPSYKELAKKYGVGVDKATINEIKGIFKLEDHPDIRRLRRY